MYACVCIYIYIYIYIHMYVLISGPQTNKTRKCNIANAWPKLQSEAEKVHLCSVRVASYSDNLPQRKNLTLISMIFPVPSLSLTQLYLVNF